MSSTMTCWPVCIAVPNESRWLWSDGGPIDRLAVEGRQAGGRAMPQVHSIGVQQQDAAQGGRHQLLDASHDGVQHGRQVFSACQHFQNVAAELLELLGVLAPVDVGEGADRAGVPPGAHAGPPSRGSAPSGPGHRAGLRRYSHW